MAFVRCRTCNGTGFTNVRANEDGMIGGADVCPQCYGTGQVAAPDVGTGGAPSRGGGCSPIFPNDEHDADRKLGCLLVIVVLAVAVPAHNTKESWWWTGAAVALLLASIFSLAFVADVPKSKLPEKKWLLRFSGAAAIALPLLFLVLWGFGWFLFCAVTYAILGALAWHHGPGPGNTATD